MKTKIFSVLIPFLVTLNTPSAFPQAQDHKILFEKAVYTMETRADLKEAITLFDSLIRTYPDEREYAANAQFHIGLCYEKLGKQAVHKAQNAYQEVIRQYGDQKEVAAIAQERLSRLIHLAEKMAAMPLTPKFTKIKIPSKLSWNAATSPDGEHLLLVYDEKLWTMPLSGNLGSDIPGIPVQLNTDSIKVTWAGFSWSGDGKTIAFNEIRDISLPELREKEGKNQIIYILSMDGGKPKKILENYCGARAVSFRMSLSPNAKTLAYSSVIEDEMYIYSIPVEGGMPRMLVESPAREPAFSPDGKMIAYVEDKARGRGGGALWIVPASGGNPTLIADAGNASSPVWSPDASKIAFIDYQEYDKINIIPVSKDGNPAGEKITIDTPEGTKEVTLLTGWDKNNKIGTIISRVNYGLYTLPAEGGQAAMVYCGNATQPRWTPDGKYILFRKGADQKEQGWPDHKLTMIPADGGEGRTILSGHQDKIGFMPFGAGNRLSPNGEDIVFSAKKTDDDSVFINHYPTTQIWTSSINNGKFTKITDPPLPYSDDCPCWSPDGRSIAFVRCKLKEDRGDLYGEMGIYIVKSSGGAPELLTFEPEKFIYSIDWSPDGKWIAYLRGDKHSSNEKSTLNIIDVNNGISRVVGEVSDFTVHTELAWSPDSKQIAFNDREGKVIKVMSLSDGSTEDIETGLVDVKVFHLDWSPDGKRFVFTGYHDGNPEYWVMEDFLPLEKLAQKSKTGVAKEPEGIAIRQVWTGIEADNCGTVSPDGKNLSFVDWETGDLAIRDLTKGTTRRLTKEATYENPQQFAYSSVISPDGKQLAYAWFNTNNFELRLLDINNPVPRILYGNNNESVFPGFWLPGGKLLAKSYNDENKCQIVCMDIPTGSNQLLKTVDSDAQIYLGPAPDNNYILYDYLTDVENENYNINLLSLDGTYETCLTEHPANDRLAGWVPGTDKVIFTSNRSGSWDLWSVQIEDGKVYGLPKRVLTEIGQISPMGITQEGSFYYGIFSSLYTGMITPFDLENGKPGLEKSIQSLPGSVKFIEWSPDGEYLACVKQYKRLEDYFQQLHILDVNTGEERSFCENLSIQNFIRWSPDGGTILTCGWDEKKRGQEDYKGGIYTIDAKTGKLNEMLLWPEIKDVVNPVRLATAEWSPVGNSIYYLYKDQIIKRNLNTGEEKIIYKGHHLKRILRLSPASNTLLFAYVNPENNKIHFCIIPAEGGKAKEICTSQETTRVRTAVWSPDGNHIFFTETPTLKYSKLWRVYADGGTPQNICQLPHLDVDLSIHPSGQKIALSYYEQTTEIRVMENLVRELEKVYSRSE
jgi:Tol biopolymer transport system component